VDVVILAGGRCDDELRAATGAEFRAEIEIGGERLVDTVLNATRPLGEAILVGGPEGLGARQVPAGENFCDSLRKGLEQVTTDQFLLVTVDLPCLTTQALQDFIDRCEPKAGLNYPIVAIEMCDEMFPGMKRTTLKLREGVFTGGNVALMDTAMMRKAVPIMEKAYELRKKPLRLAMIVGIGVLGRVVLGQIVPKTLDLPSLERALGKFLKVPVHAVPTDFAELGADLDKADQYEIFQRLKKVGM